MKNYFCELSKSYWEEILDKKFYKEKKLRIVTVNLGTVIPPKKKDAFQLEGPLFGWGGVLDENYKYVDLSSQNAMNMRSRVSGKENMFVGSAKIVDEPVIYMNFFIQQWGHYLIDVIGRLWYALHYDTTTKIVYSCFEGGGNEEIKGNYLKLLELMGIKKDRLICVNQATKFKKVIVPEMAIYPGDYYTIEYKKMFDCVIEKCMNTVNKSGTEKVYCSRAMLQNNKKEVGEAKIEWIFRENGYAIKYMETLSLEEQIIMLNKASVIVMLNGSLAHNLLFLRKDATVVIINKTYRFNLHQIMINQISNVNVVYVDAYVAPLPVLYGKGPFIIKKTGEFLEFLKDFGILENKGTEQKLKMYEKLNYYLKWIFTYKKNLIYRKKIEEGNSEIPNKKIREYYKKSQRVL